MNETIKGWIGGIKNPLLRLFLGVLILAVISLFTAREYDSQQRIKGMSKALSNKDRIIAHKDSLIAECAEQKFIIVSKQNERLEERQDRQDTAKKIISGLK